MRQHELDTGVKGTRDEVGRRGLKRREENMRAETRHKDTTGTNNGEGDTTDSHTDDDIVGTCP